jgi:CRP-like cAMP-binding protein
VTTPAPRRAAIRVEGTPTSTDVAQAFLLSPLFSSIHEQNRLELARRARIVTLGGSQRLWSAGDEATRIGLVLSGRLKLVRSVGEREVIVDLALRGDLVGEAAFALGTTYGSSAVCLRRSRVLVVDAPSLRLLIERERGPVDALVTNLAIRVRRLTRAVQVLSAGNVERRLARVLVGLVDRVGEPFPGGVLVPLRLRRGDLAALAATSSESVSRKLGTWSRSGWIVPQPAGYLIRDVKALRRIVEGRPPDSTIIDPPELGRR